MKKEEESMVDQVQLDLIWAGLGSVMVGKLRGRWREKGEHLGVHAQSPRDVCASF